MMSNTEDQTEVYQEIKVQVFDNQKLKLKFCWIYSRIHVQCSMYMQLFYRFKEILNNNREVYYDKNNWTKLATPALHSQATDWYDKFR